MSFLGNVFNFEQFKLGNMWDKVKKNPEQLFIGAADPFSAGVWSKVTGKKYEPLVDQWGGATPDDYSKAEAAGIDTSAGRTLHGAARTIAGLYAGKAGAKAMGSGSSSGGLLDFSGGQAAAPIVDMSSPATASSLQGLNTSAGAGGSGGMLSSFSQGLDVANKAGGLLGGFGGGQNQPQQPMQHAQANPQVFSSLLSPTDQVDMEKRRQAQQMAVQGLLGGYRG